MKDIVNIVLVGVTIFLFCNIVAVPAQSNHTLEWGVEVGDEITYVLEKKYLDASFSNQMQDYSFFLDKIDEGQNITARVTHLEPIPDLINESREMPTANCTLLRGNDSEVIAEVFPMIAVPMGDWDFSTEMTSMNWSEDATIVDTPEEWGTSIASKMIFAIFIIEFSMDIRYFKANGTLSLLSIHVEVGGTEMIDIRLVAYQSNLTFTTTEDSFPIEQFAIYAGIASLIIIILVLFKRRRSNRTQGL